MRPRSLGTNSHRHRYEILTNDCTRYLYAAIISMDANFRLKNNLVSNYSQDPGLGIGWAYLVPRVAYEMYVLSRASDENVRPSPAV